MYRIQHLLCTFAILLLFNGCTSFQVEEARRSMTLGLLGLVADGATKKLTDEIPYETSPHVQARQDQAEREEEARRRDEREKRHYEKIAKSIVDKIEQPEQQSGQLQTEAAIADHERQIEERLSRRVETFENQAEFDRFMRELETAEEQNNDAPLKNIH